MVSEVVEYGEDRVVFDTFSRYSDTGPGTTEYILEQ